VLATASAGWAAGITAAQYDLELIPQAGEGYAQSWVAGSIAIEAEQST
jgi:hypothetical protein